MRKAACLVAVAIVVALGVVLTDSYRTGRLTGVSANFGVKPGGRDVVVNLDGRRVRPGLFSHVSPESNLYDVGFPTGNHTLTISKPGYKTIHESITIDKSAGEWYGYYELKPWGETSDRRRLPNPWQKWVGALDADGTVLVAPGMLQDYVYNMPLFVVDFGESSSWRVRSPQMILCDVVTHPASGSGIASAEVVDKPFGYALFKYHPKSNKLRRLLSLSDAALMGLVYSPDGQYVAGWLWRKGDIQRDVDWYVNMKLGKKPEPRPQPDRTPCVVDAATGDITRIAGKGAPLCWSRDGSEVYIRSEMIAAYDLETEELREVSKRTNVVKAFDSTRLGGLVTVVQKGPGLSLELVDESFNSIKRLGDISCPDSSVEPSPDGSFVAYRIGKRYYVMSLDAGTPAALTDLEGDMDPAWVGDDLLLVGDSGGPLSLVTLQGVVKSSYVIPELVNEE